MLCLHHKGDNWRGLEIAMHRAVHRHVEVRLTQNRPLPVLSLTAQMTPSLPAHTRAKPTMAPTAGASRLADI